MLLQFYDTEAETGVNVDPALIPDLVSEVSIKVDTEPLFQAMHHLYSYTGKCIKTVVFYFNGNRTAGLTQV